MTTAILGGAFDPPHLGHLALAEGALGSLGADRLLVLVVVSPGHKETVLDAQARLELTRLAFADLDAEVRLDDHAYTVDFLRDEKPADAVFVLGADEWAAFFDTWKEPEEVRRLIPIAVAARPGEPEPRGDVTVFEIDQRPISSSEVRDRIAEGLPIDEFVPAAVAREIERRALYRGVRG